MIHKLTKRQVFRAYVLLRQAERSIDHTLISEDTNDLVENYEPESRELLQKSLFDFKDTLKGHMGELEPLRASIEGQSKLTGLIVRRIVGLLLAGLPVCLFTTVEVGWIYHCLRHICDLIVDQKPLSQVERARLRMDITTAEFLILCRCVLGLDYKRAFAVANVGQPNFIRHYLAADLLARDIDNNLEAQ